MSFPHKVGLSATAAVIALLSLASPLLATPADDASTVAVRHANLAPATSAQANVLLNRLSEAAMEACGASTFSVMQHRQAVRGSACWRTSMTDVVQRIDNPRLTAAFERRGTAQLALGAGEGSGGH